MEEQKYDLLLSLANNSGSRATVVDLVDSGLSADNAELLDKEEYKKKEEVQNLFTDPNTGKFNDEVFNKVYNAAETAYSQLGTLSDIKKTSSVFNEKTGDFGTAWKKIVAGNDKSQVIRAKGDSFTDTPQSQKTDILKSSWTGYATPLLNSVGLEKAFGLDGNKPWSVAEVAAMELVKDFNTGEWFTPTFLIDNLPFIGKGTKVLATYDEDTTDEDGQFHEKGSYKINERGHYYYETLGNRSVYGKEVYNVFNNITDERDWINKYDFFDSDDISKKNPLGSILKTVCLVGPMFLPYVGPVVAGASVLMQLSSMFGTATKMATDAMGLETMQWLNELESWTKQFERTATTEYTRKDPFTFENLLSIAGDACALLKEQRWIVEGPVRLFGTDARLGVDFAKATTLEEMDALIKKTIDLKIAPKYANEVKATLNKIGKDNVGTEIEKLIKLQEYLKAIESAHQMMAKNFLEKQIKKNVDLTAAVSKAYMTFLTTKDSYGEAIAQGLPQDQALALALGYTAAEALLLNTNIGERVLPELHMHKLNMRNKINALVGDTVKEVDKLNLPKGSSKELVSKSIFNKAKESFIKIFPKWNKLGPDYVGIGEEAGGVAWSKALLAASLGEGLEETSEELLADMSKTAVSLYREINGQERIDLGEWKDWDSRYLLSAFGGAIGGGANHLITHLQGGFNSIRNFGKFEGTSADAILSIVLDPEQLALFEETLDAMPIASTTKSFDFDKETGVYKAATKYEDSLDAIIKLHTKNMINYTKSILDSHGASFSSESVMNLLTGETRKNFADLINLYHLRGTKTLDFQIKHLRNLLSLLISAVMNLEKVDPKSKLDSATRSKKDEALIEKYTADIESISAEIDKYRSGQIIPEVAEVALFEANPALKAPFMNKNFAHLTLFTEAKFGKPWDKISDLDKANAKKEWEEIKDFTNEEDIAKAYRTFKYTVDNTSEYIKNSFQQIHENQSLKLNALELFRKDLVDSNKNFLLNIQDESKLNEIIDTYLTLINEILRLRLTYVFSKGKTTPLTEDDILLIEMSNILTPEELEYIKQNKKLAKNNNGLEPIEKEIFKKLLNHPEDVKAERNLYPKGLIRDIYLLNWIRNRELADRSFNYPTEEESSNLNVKEDDLNPHKDLGFLIAPDINTLSKEFTDLSTGTAVEINTFKNFSVPFYDLQRKTSQFLALKNDLDLEEYLHPETVSYYSTILNEMLNLADSLQKNYVDHLKRILPDYTISENFFKEHSEFYNQLESYKESIKTVLESLGKNEDGSFKEEIPILLLITGFNSKLGNESPISQRALELFNKLHAIIKSKDRFDFSQLFIGEEDKKAIKVILSLLATFKSILTALRKDNADISNIKGYSPLLNNINRALGISSKELVELDQTDVDLTLSALEPISTTLDTYIKLFNFNLEAKLKNEPKLQLNHQINFYKAYLLYLCPSEADKNKYRETFPTLDKLAKLTLSNDYNPLLHLTADLDTLNKAFIESVALEDSIYDFFNSEDFKNEKGEIDFTRFANIIADTVFQEKRMIDFANTSMSLTNKAYNNRLFALKLVECISVKSSKINLLYKNFLDTLQNFAPIYAQELAIKRIIAYYANKDTFDKGIQSLKEAALINSKNYPGKLGDYNFKNLDELEASNFLPVYENSILINGLPGVGKSMATMALAIGILHSLDPENCSNIGFVHNTQKNAEDTIKEFLKSYPKLKGEAYDTLKFLKTFFGEEFHKLSDADKLNEKDQEKNIINIGEGNLLKLNPQVILSVKQKTKCPKIFFIDEASHYSLGVLKAISVAAQQNNFIVIYGADFSQIGKAQIITSSKGEDKTTSPAASQFNGSEILTSLIRTDNNVLSLSIKNFSDYIVKTIENSSTSIPTIYYYDKDNEFKGINIQEVDYKEAIEKLRQASSSTDTIFYIDDERSYNPNGEVAKYILSLNDPRISYTSVKKSQGKECSYSIYYGEIGSALPKLQSFYTAVTRAKKGAIAIPKTKITSPICNIIKKESYTKEQLTPEQIKRAVVTKLNLLSLLELSCEPLTKEDLLPWSVIRPNDSPVIIKEDPEETIDSNKTFKKDEAERMLREGEAFLDNVTWKLKEDKDSLALTNHDSWRTKKVTNGYIIEVTYIKEGQQITENYFDFKEKYELLKLVDINAQGKGDEGDIIKDPFTNAEDPDNSEEDFDNVASKYNSSISAKVMENYKGEIDAILYTFNTLTGAGLFDNEGKINTSYISNNRQTHNMRDVVGLIKMYLGNISDLNKDKLLKDLKQIKYFLYFSKTKEDMLNNIFLYLSDNNYLTKSLKEDRVNFDCAKLLVLTSGQANVTSSLSDGSKVSTKKPIADAPIALLRTDVDKVFDVVTGQGEYSDFPSNTIQTVFGFKKVTKKSKRRDLEICLDLTTFTLCNPLTLLQYKDAKGNKIFDRFYQTYNDNYKKEEGVRGALEKVLAEVEEVLEGTAEGVEKENLKYLHAILQTFLRSNFVYRLENLDYNYAKDNTGLSFMNRSYVSDMKKNTKYAPKYIELKDIPDPHTPPMVAASNITYGNTVILKGHPFIIVLANPQGNFNEFTNSLSAEDALNAFKKQEQQRAEGEDIIPEYELYYVSEPQVEIDTYIENLLDFIYNVKAQNSHNISIGYIGHLYSLFKALRKSNWFNYEDRGDNREAEMFLSNLLRQNANNPDGKLDKEVYDNIEKALKTLKELEATNDIGSIAEDPVKNHILFGKNSRSTFVTYDSKIKFLLIKWLKSYFSQKIDPDGNIVPIEIKNNPEATSFKDLVSNEDKNVINEKLLKLKEIWKLHQKDTIITKNIKRGKSNLGEDNIRLFISDEGFMVKGKPGGPVFLSKQMAQELINAAEPIEEGDASFVAVFRGYANKHCLPLDEDHLDEYSLDNTKFDRDYYEPGEKIEDSSEEGEGTDEKENPLEKSVLDLLGPLNISDGAKTYLSEKKVTSKEAAEEFIFNDTKFKNFLINNKQVLYKHNGNIYIKNVTDMRAQDLNKPGVTIKSIDFKNNEDHSLESFSVQMNSNGIDLNKTYNIGLYPDGTLYSFCLTASDIKHQDSLKYNFTYKTDDDTEYTKEDDFESEGTFTLVKEENLKEEGEEYYQFRLRDDSNEKELMISSSLPIDMGDNDLLYLIDNIDDTGSMKIDLSEDISLQLRALCHIIKDKNLPNETMLIDLPKVNSAPEQSSEKIDYVLINGETIEEVHSIDQNKNINLSNGKTISYNENSYLLDGELVKVQKLHMECFPVEI